MTLDTFESGQKKCNFCGESIPVASKRCQFCGSVLDSTEGEAAPIEKEEAFSADVSGENGEPTANESETSLVPDEVKKDENVFINQPQINKTPDRPTEHSNDEGGIGNGMKVFLTTLCTFIPMLGQIAGIIVSIVFMNSSEKDKRSFGVALLIASLITFVISCLLCFVLIIASRVVAGSINLY